MKKRIFPLLILLVFVMMSLVGCSSSAPEKAADKTPAPPAQKEVKMATTTSTQDSGLLDVILPEFTKDTGYEIKVIAVGSGQAISMGEAGDVDVLLVHSRAAEDKFVADGFGVNRKDVMCNDFLILGAKDDPAGIKGMIDVAKALKKISEAKATFLSRGDDSGTHKKELTLWDAAQIKPEGDWYKSVGKGMGDTYRMADEMKGYVLIDRASYLFNRGKYQLEEMVQGDKALFNPYGVIAVSHEKYSNTNYDGAMAFVNWITGEKAQKMIGEYGKDKFKQTLFVPDAK